MDADTWIKSSSNCESLNPSPNSNCFSNFNSQQQKWENSPFLDYEALMEQGFPDFNNNNHRQKCESQDKRASEAQESNKMQDWDPRTMLNNLSFLEKNIHQLREMVHLVVARRSQASGQADELLAQQQQLITAELTSVIVQLISTAGSLLPSAKNSLLLESSISQLGQFSGTINQLENVITPQTNTMVVDKPIQTDLTGFFSAEQNFTVEDHEMKSDDDVDEGENLPPGSYEILQLEKEEILAPHTHFCKICGKGFKRDANLRMHMRGHGDEYKTAAALAKPNKEASCDPFVMKRYSCPYAGCKRNKDHKKFQPLKTILCVKNHYKRTHCDKNYTCSRCNTKKFSVLADLKTHQKHCGKDKWLCSCGTTFSRKDKLFGHVALFQGHTPAIPVEELKGGSTAPPSDDRGQCREPKNKVEQLDFSHNSSDIAFQNVMDEKVSAEDPTDYFSSLAFDASSMNGYQEFPRPPFDDSDSSFSFMLSGACAYHPKNGRFTGGSNDME